MKHISSQFLFYNKWIDFLPILLILNTVVAEAQISTLNSNNGSITISPKGLKGNTNNGTDTTNIALGTDALQSNTSGYENTAIGVYALQLNTTGHYNTANGYRALISNTTVPILLLEIMPLEATLQAPLTWQMDVARLKQI